MVLPYAIYAVRNIVYEYFQNAEQLDSLKVFIKIYSSSGSIHAWNSATERYIKELKRFLTFDLTEQSRLLRIIIF